MDASRSHPTTSRLTRNLAPPNCFEGKIQEKPMNKRTLLIPFILVGLLGAGCSQSQPGGSAQAPAATGGQGQQAAGGQSAAPAAAATVAQASVPDFSAIVEANKA